MADNFTFTAGSGSTGAADEVGGILFPRVKIALGADGYWDMDLDSGQQTMVNSMPVAIATNQSDVPITLDGETVVLGAGSASIGKLGANSGVDIGDVDVTSSALPTGASTSANQTTIIGHVDGIEGLLTTIDADTSTIAGDTTSIDGKITACNTGDVTIGAAIPAGTNLIGNIKISDGTETANVNASNELQVRDDDANTDLDTIAGDTTSIDGKITACNTGAVTISAALPAGTNAIGKLSANSGVDIGDVDVTSLPALASGTNTIGKVAPNEYELAGNTTHVKKYYTSAGAVTDGIVWSPAAGKRWYITDIIINVSADATVTLEDDLAAGDSAVFKAELSAKSGWDHSFTTPLFSGEDAADLLITTDTGNVYVTVTGYEI